MCGYSIRVRDKVRDRLRLGLGIVVVGLGIGLRDSYTTGNKLQRNYNIAHFDIYRSTHLQSAFYL